MRNTSGRMKPKHYQLFLISHKLRTLTGLIHYYYPLHGGIVARFPYILRSHHKFFSLLKIFFKSAEFEHMARISH